MCVALAVRAPQSEHALRAEAARRVLRGEAALLEAELVVGAAGDGVVALPRIERALDDAQRLDELGDDEVRVGVAVAVEVAALVDGHAADGELDVLPLARVEAAQEDLLGVPLAALVREQDPGRELEQLARVLARHARELADVEVEVGRARLGGVERPWTFTSSGCSAAGAAGAGRGRGAVLARPAGSPAGRVRLVRAGGVSTTSGGGAGGAKWNGTLMRLATGLPSRIAGRERPLPRRDDGRLVEVGRPRTAATSTFET